jgi:hypothetical protein
MLGPVLKIFFAGRHNKDDDTFLYILLYFLFLRALQ